MKSPTFVIISEFAPWWLRLWELTNRLGFARAQKYLEMHPRFIVRREFYQGATRRLRYAAYRTTRRSDGAQDWGLCFDPGTEPAYPEWPAPDPRAAQVA
jgi:hypothetical protein